MSITTSISSKPITTGVQSFIIGGNTKLSVSQGREGVSVTIKDKSFVIFNFSDLPVKMFDTAQCGVRTMISGTSLWLGINYFDINGTFNTRAYEFDASSFMLLNSYLNQISDLKYSTTQMALFKPDIRVTTINGDIAIASFCPPADPSTDWPLTTVGYIPVGRVLLWRPVADIVHFINTTPAQGYNWGVSHVTINNRYVAVVDSFISDTSLSLESSGQKVSARIHIFCYDSGYTNAPVDIGVISKTSSVLSDQDMGWVDDSVLAIREDTASTVSNSYFVNVQCYTITGTTSASFRADNTAYTTLNPVSSVTPVNTATANMRIYDTPLRWLVGKSYFALVCFIPSLQTSAVVLYNYKTGTFTKIGTWYLSGFPMGFDLSLETTMTTIRLQTIDTSKNRFGFSKTIKVSVPV